MRPVPIMDIHLKPIVNFSGIKITGHLRRFAELDSVTQVVGWAAQKLGRSKMFKKSPLAWVPLPEEGTNCAQAPWQPPSERVPKSLYQIGGLR